MKLRTDFVTNSSSSSFVTIKLGEKEILFAEDIGVYYESAKQLGDAVKTAKCKNGNDLAVVLKDAITNVVGDNEFWDYYPELLESIEKIKLQEDVSSEKLLCEIWWQGWGESEEEEHEGATSVIGKYELNLKTNRGKYWVEED